MINVFKRLFTVCVVTTTMWGTMTYLAQAQTTSPAILFQQANTAISAYQNAPNSTSLATATLDVALLKPYNNIYVSSITPSVAAFPGLSNSTTSLYTYLHIALGASIYNVQVAPAIASYNSGKTASNLQLAESAVVLLLNYYDIQASIVNSSVIANLNLYIYALESLPYTSITNCPELQGMKNNLNAVYVLAENIDCSGFGASQGFTPIGNSASQPFMGSLTGLSSDGKTVFGINNLTINQTDPNAQETGLFGFVEGTVAQPATITNLKLTNVSVSINVLTPTITQYVATLVGKTLGNTIVSKIFINGGTLLAGPITNSYQPLLAGLVAYISATNGNDIVEQVSVNNLDFQGSPFEEAGIAGINDGTINQASANVFMLTNDTDVSSGLVNQNQGTIENSYASGTINDTNGSDGLVNVNLGAIIDCYSVVKLIGNDRNGLVGGQLSGYTSNSYWDTQVSGTLGSQRGAGESTAQMYQQSTFTGWDFINTWRIQNGVDYPHLQSEPVQLTLNLTGNGSGTITSSPAGISCSTGSTVGCTAAFAYNQPVKLTFTGNNSFVVADWGVSGCATESNSCTITPDTNLVQNIAVLPVIVPILRGTIINATTQQTLTAGAWSNPAMVVTGPYGSISADPIGFPNFQMFNLVAGTYNVYINMEGHPINYSFTVAANSPYNYSMLKIPFTMPPLTLQNVTVALSTAPYNGGLVTTGTITLLAIDPQASIGQVNAILSSPGYNNINVSLTKIAGNTYSGSGIMRFVTVGQQWSVASVTIIDVNNYSTLFTNGKDYTANFNIPPLPPAPVITTQPLNQEVNPGTSVTFSVAANSSVPLTYQWQLNGSNITGATNVFYTIKSVAPINSGSYTVVVSNVGGNVTSNAATLIVNGPPTIISQPANQTVSAGSPVTFTVVASGTPSFTYQWYNENTGVIAGANSSTYTISSPKTSDSGNYLVSVCNSIRCASSNLATLTVTPSIPITVPTGLSGIAISSTQIFLSWSSQTGPVAGFNIYRNGVQVGNLVNIGHLWFTDSNLTPSTTYSYTISAYDANGNNTAQSSPVNVETLAAPITGPVVPVPTGLSGYALSSTQIYLGWNTPTGQIAGFIIYRNGVQVANLVNIGHPWYTDSGLTPGTTYSYTIVAYDNSGNNSVQSSPVNIQTLSGSSIVPVSNGKVVSTV